VSVVLPHTFEYVSDTDPYEPLRYKPVPPLLTMLFVTCTVRVVPLAALRYTPRLVFP
jgi:hypothetical protein